jgi:hypothetical protein
MESRVANVIDLPEQYDTPHGLKQLNASIICAREYVRELLATGARRPALNLAERIFDFCLKRRALQLYQTKSIDCFAAVECHPEYGEAFRDLRFPQMQQLLARKRAG